VRRTRVLLDRRDKDVERRVHSSKKKRPLERSREEHRALWNPRSTEGSIFTRESPIGDSFSGDQHKVQTHSDPSAPPFSVQSVPALFRAWLTYQ
jgi:hypothetical protein